MYSYRVTIQIGGTIKDVTTEAKSWSQAMANVVEIYPGALVIRVV